MNSVMIEDKEGFFSLENEEWGPIKYGHDHPYANRIIDVLTNVASIAEPYLDVTLNKQQETVINWVKLSIEHFFKRGLEMSFDGTLFLHLQHDGTETYNIIYLPTKMALRGSLIGDQREVVVNTQDWDFLIGDLDAYCRDIFTSEEMRKVALEQEGNSKLHEALDEEISEYFREKIPY